MALAEVSEETGGSCRILSHVEGHDRYSHLQNLTPQIDQILKENGLKEYDVHRLLILADGRCAQDECFITPLRTGAFPQELSRRLAALTM